MDILIVVDMQPNFPASKDRTTLFNVGAEIKQAMKEGHFIIFLEYNRMGCEATSTDLLNLVVGYDDWCLLEKGQDDGSDEIKEALGKRGNPAVSCFRLCGVNKGFCVASTADELARKYPHSIVEIAEEACNCKGGCYKDCAPGCHKDHVGCGFKTNGTDTKPNIVFV